MGDVARLADRRWRDRHAGRAACCCTASRSRCWRAIAPALAWPRPRPAIGLCRRGAARQSSRRTASAGATRAGSSRCRWRPIIAQPGRRCWRASCWPSTGAARLSPSPAFDGGRRRAARRRRAADLCRVLRRDHARRPAAGRRARAAPRAAGAGAARPADCRWCRRACARRPSAAPRGSRMPRCSPASTRSDPGDYELLLATQRPTLVQHFKAHGYRTVSWMPGLQKPWPEGSFYGFDRYADAEQHRLSRAGRSATGAFRTRPRWRCCRRRNWPAPPAPARAALHRLPDAGQPCAVPSAGALRGRLGPAAARRCLHAGQSRRRRWPSRCRG